MNKHGCIAWAAAGLLAWGMAHGQTGEGLFAQGTEAFREGDYATALERYEAAARSGFESPRLHYNLGVVRYRLGEYDQAIDDFLVAARHAPLAALAHYNLGLVELKRGNEQQARQWFRSTADETRDAKLRALADRMLKRLQEPARFASVTANLGYDDNVIDPEDLAASERGDSFLELFAGGALALNRGAEPWWLEGGIYRLDYMDVDSFDLLSLRAGVRRSFVRGVQVGADASRATLGGEGYQRTFGIHAAAGGANGWPRIRYSFSAIEADTAFDYLDGSRQRVDLDASRTFGEARLRLGYRYEVDRRDDLSTATTFTSFSPARQGIEAELDFPLQAEWRATARAGYRSSSYDDANVLSDGTRIVREDDRVEFGLRLTRDLGRDWEVAFEYLSTDNRSNIDAYDYTRNQLSAGLTKAF